MVILSRRLIEKGKKIARKKISMVPGGKVLSQAPSLKPSKKLGGSGRKRTAPPEEKTIGESAKEEIKEQQESIKAKTIPKAVIAKPEIKPEETKSTLVSAVKTFAIPGEQITKGFIRTEEAISERVVKKVVPRGGVIFPQPKEEQFVTSKIPVIRTIEKGVFKTEKFVTGLLAGQVEFFREKPVTTVAIEVAGAKAFKVIGKGASKVITRFKKPVFEVTEEALDIGASRVLKRGETQFVKGTAVGRVGVKRTIGRQADEFILTTKTPFKAGRIGTKTFTTGESRVLLKETKEEVATAVFGIGEEAIEDVTKVAGKIDIKPRGRPLEQLKVKGRTTLVSKVDADDISQEIRRGVFETSPRFEGEGVKTVSGFLGEARTKVSKGNIQIGVTKFATKTVSESDVIKIAKPTTRGPKVQFIDEGVSGASTIRATSGGTSGASELLQAQTQVQKTFTSSTVGAKVSLVSREAAVASVKGLPPPSFRQIVGVRVPRVTPLPTAKTVTRVTTPRVTSAQQLTREKVYGTRISAVSAKPSQIFEPSTASRRISGTTVGLKSLTSQKVTPTVSNVLGVASAGVFSTALSSSIAVAPVTAQSQAFGGVVSFGVPRSLPPPFVAGGFVPIIAAALPKRLRKQTPKKKKKKSRKARFAPGLAALELNIRAPKEPTVLSPFTVRPIVGRTRF